MSHKQTTVFVVLDGFRWDYINPQDTPYLFSLANNGIYVQKLISSTGFTQRSGMFTGAYPDVTGNFTLFYYARERSPYGFLTRYAKALDWAERVVHLFPYPIEARWQWIVRQGIVRNMARQKVSYPVVGNVPYRILQFLSPCEDAERYLHEPGALPVETLFDVLFCHRKHVVSLMYPVASGSGSTVLRAAQDHVDLQADFYTFQFNDSDTKIHKLGSEGLARRMIASEIDRNIKELVRLFQHKYHQIKLVIIGDHGMMDCSIAIDVWHLMVSFARKSGLRQFKDYLLFIDSTMARVWFLSDLAAELFDDVRSLDVLQSHGRFMSDELCQQYRIPALGKKYGELIWWANPGVLIHPCYWHSKKDEIKAMHGYDTYHDKMKGFAIVSCDLAKPAFIQEARLVDICPTLCDLIGVRYPEKNEGKSLLKQASESRGG